MATTKNGKIGRKFSSFTCDFSLATSSSSSITHFQWLPQLLPKSSRIISSKKSHICVAPFYFPLFAKKSGLHFLFLPAVGFLTGFNTAAASMRLPPSSIATVRQILFLQQKNWQLYNCCLARLLDICSAGQEEFSNICNYLKNLESHNNFNCLQSNAAQCPAPLRSWKNWVEHCSTANCSI